jgi:hypothetical protein
MAEEEQGDRVEPEVACRNCNEILREPRFLPCLHSFCTPCLKEIAKATSPGSLHCPTCKSKCVTADVEALPANYWAPILIAQRFKDRAIVRMDKCEKVAVKRCQDCEDFICEECAELHRTYPRFKSHRVFGIDEYEAQPDKGLKQVYCAAHPDKVQPAVRCSGLLSASGLRRVGPVHVVSRAQQKRAPPSAIISCCALYACTWCVWVRL